MSAPFNITEYAVAEARFIHAAVDALSRARGGIIAAIPREPASRVGATQFTTDDGRTVEMASLEIAEPIAVEWEDIAAGIYEPLMEGLDDVAEKHHDQLSRYFFSSLETVTEATGNQVDASGKSFFEYMYEMFDKIELSFEPDGSISPDFVLVVHPDTYEAMKRHEAEMTANERQRLDELMDRKRQEYFARRRRRQLS